MTKKEKTFKMIKTGVSLISTFLVDMFIGAVTNSVMNGVKGGKVAKIGAKAGGFLVGMYIGDQVADHLCDGFDDILKEIDDIEASVEEEGDA